MRRAMMLCAAVLCLTMTLAPTALAAGTNEVEICYPTAITQSEDGTELRKLYDLGPEDDPTGIPRSDFEQDGFHYTLTDLLRQELPEHDERQHTETVSLQSANKDMASILALLPQEKEFITEDGYILTNHHVISDASSVKVTLYNGETYDAKVIGSDEDYDIAVLKIDVTGATPVVLGDSSKVAIGESVAAVGNPLGELTFSMSEGIVSCVNRAINVDGTPFNMIQVDCSINPGNSGGPLFNSYGEVIGIVSAKYSSYSNTTVEGIGFAIPINDVVSLVKDIMTNGYVTNKAYMGITPQTMTAQMAQQYRYDVTEGVFVCSVDPDSAAAKAGLKLGDVITKMDDTDITSYEDLVAAKKSYSAGDTVTLTVYREGKTIEVELTFDAAPETTETSSSDQSTDNSYNGNGGYGNGGNGYYSNPWDFFNNFFGYGG